MGWGGPDPLSPALGTHMFSLYDIYENCPPNTFHANSTMSFSLFLLLNIFMV